MKSLFNFAVVSSALSILTATVSVADAEPIRVACLGDSITAGERVAATTQSYPVACKTFWVTTMKCGTWHRRGNADQDGAS